MQLSTENYVTSKKLSLYQTFVSLSHCYREISQ